MRSPRSDGESGGLQIRYSVVLPVYGNEATLPALIDRLKAKSGDTRTGDDWWQLGEYQIVQGLSAGDESAINAGSQALMKGAHLTPPHAGCQLDLSEHVLGLV